MKKSERILREYLKSIKLEEEIKNKLGLDVKFDDMEIDMVSEWLGDLERREMWNELYYVEHLESLIDEGKL